MIRNSFMSEFIKHFMRHPIFASILTCSGLHFLDSVEGYEISKFTDKGYNINNVKIDSLNFETVYIAELDDGYQLFCYTKNEIVYEKADSFFLSELNLQSKLDSMYHANGIKKRIFSEKIEGYIVIITLKYYLDSIMVSVGFTRE